MYFLRNNCLRVAKRTPSIRFFNNRPLRTTIHSFNIKEKKDSSLLTSNLEKHGFFSTEEYKAPSTDFINSIMLSIKKYVPNDNLGVEIPLKRNKKSFMTSNFHPLKISLNDTELTNTIHHCLTPLSQLFDKGFPDNPITVTLLNYKDTGIREQFVESPHLDKAKQVHSLKSFGPGSSSVLMLHQFSCPRHSKFEKYKDYLFLTPIFEHLDNIHTTVFISRRNTKFFKSSIEPVNWNEISDLITKYPIRMIIPGKAYTARHAQESEIPIIKEIYESQNTERVTLHELVRDPRQPRAAVLASINII